MPATALCLLATLALGQAVQPPSTLAITSPRVLVFSKTAAFRHDSIPTGIETLRKMASEKNFTVEATEDAAQFNDKNLQKFDVVVFLSTTGDVLDDAQQSAMERFIRRGGGYAGIHAAADTEYGWAWYGQLAGGYFKRHPQIQKADVHVEDRAHPSSAFLPGIWTRTDEWYCYRTSPRPNVQVLASLDEKSYKGGTMGDDHPIAWCHPFDGGRAWYTGMGHTKESYAEPLFQEHVYQGILWAANAKPAAGFTPLMDFTKDWGAPKGWSVAGDARLDGANPGRIMIPQDSGAAVFASLEGRGAGLVSKRSFADAQVHVEFLVPKNGNSGVYLQGRYEIQILDSHGVPDKDLQSSMCGSVYERWKDDKGYEGVPPKVNAARPAGQWQSFDILFRAPRFRAGKKVENARFLEVRLNGVLVQKGVQVTGPTRAAMFEDEKPLGPIFLQGDHGPIAYRNLSVKPLKLR